MDLPYSACTLRTLVPYNNFFIGAISNFWTVLKHKNTFADNWETCKVHVLVSVKNNGTASYSSSEMCDFFFFK